MKYNRREQIIFQSRVATSKFGRKPLSNIKNHSTILIEVCFFLFLVRFGFFLLFLFSFILQWFLFANDSNQRWFFQSFNQSLHLDSVVQYLDGVDPHLPHRGSEPSRQICPYHQKLLKSSSLSRLRKTS